MTGLGRGLGRHLTDPLFATGSLLLLAAGGAAVLGFVSDAGCLGPVLAARAPEVRTA